VRHPERGLDVPGEKIETDERGMAANASANDWVVWLSSGLQLPQIIVIGSGDQGQSAQSCIAPNGFPAVRFARLRRSELNSKRSRPGEPPNGWAEEKESYDNQEPTNVECALPSDRDPVKDDPECDQSD